MRKLKDQDLRNLLLKDLHNIYRDDNSTKIINEMGVLHGQSRIDVAVINGILHGFEIKSESDNLLRLPSQMEDYNKVFDKMTIVIQRNHLKEVREVIPKWWGIWLVTYYQGDYRIREIRKGKTNNNVDPYSLSHLLWRDEALEVLKERGLQKGLLSKPREELYAKICNSISLSEIQGAVNRWLKVREGWRAH
ncbi:sce7726 family protein [Scopulibacillus darangshiensis]|nr:sce7726 family protein [Scopulibacillus darangshiensis]